VRIRWVLSLLGVLSLTLLLVHLTQGSLSAAQEVPVKPQATLPASPPITKADVGRWDADLVQRAAGNRVFPPCYALRHAATVPCLGDHFRRGAGTPAGTLLCARPRFLDAGWMRQYCPHAVQPGPSAKVPIIAKKLRTDRRRQTAAFRPQARVWNADRTLQES
jgi:hypothetical protein